MPASNHVATINDVAKRAGVSITTVSHVQSGNRPVSPSTARRVAQAMLDLRYTPNRAARTLALGSPQALALLVPDITNTFFAELAKGAEDAADSHGYGLLLGNASFDRRRELHYLDSLRSRAVDGLIYVAGAPPDHDYLAQLARQFPMAIVDEEIDDVSALMVLSDNYNGGAQVADCLIDLGHRSIAMIAGPARLPTSVQRSAGFLDRVKTRQIGAGSTVRIMPGSYDQESGYQAVATMLRAKAFEQTAIFALNDLMAVGAIRALHDAGLEVPRDVSVVGYDDTSLGANITPTLTSVYQPAYRLGATAAEQLLRWIISKEQPDPMKTVLEVKLVQRASTAVAMRK
jgi:LacI family transcriptional regulator